MSSPSSQKEIKGRKLVYTGWLELGNIITGFSITQLAGIYRDLKEIENDEFPHKIFFNFAYSNLYLGGLIGVFVAYRLLKTSSIDRLHKIFCFTTIFSVLPMIVALSYNMILISRFILGGAVGMSFMLIPNGLKEVGFTSNTKRAIFSSIFETLGVTIGILLANLNENISWHFIRFFPVFISLVSLIAGILFKSLKMEGFNRISKIEDPNKLKNRMKKPAKLEINRTTQDNNIRARLFAQIISIHTSSFIYLLTFSSSIYESILNDKDAERDYNLILSLGLFITALYNAPINKMSTPRNIKNYGLGLFSCALALFTGLSHIENFEFLLVLGHIISLMIFLPTICFAKWFLIIKHNDLKHRLWLGATYFFISFLVCHFPIIITEVYSIRAYFIITSILSTITWCFDRIRIFYKRIKTNTSDTKPNVIEELPDPLQNLFEEIGVPQLKRYRSASSDVPFNEAESPLKTPQFNKKKRSSMDTVPIENRANYVYTHTNSNALAIDSMTSPSGVQLLTSAGFRIGDTLEFNASGVLKSSSPRIDLVDEVKDNGELPKIIVVPRRTNEKEDDGDDDNLKLSPLQYSRNNRAVSFGNQNDGQK